MPKCTCDEGYMKCKFKVHAKRLRNQQTWQIKSLILQHRCMRSKINSMVTAEYLSERYLEDWRSQPGMKISDFQEKVLKDIGIQISYTLAWLARGRAKLTIYGSASEQYARVWDYGKAVWKYNPDSRCIVLVDGVEQPEPPLFMRMFVSLGPLRDGFVRGL